MKQAECVRLHSLGILRPHFAPRHRPRSTGFHIPPSRVSESGPPPMWDVPAPDQPEHLSHDLPCRVCHHDVHLLACGDECDCPPCVMPGSC